MVLRSPLETTVRLGVAVVTEQKRQSSVAERPELADFGGFDGV